MSGHTPWAQVKRRPPGTNEDHSVNKREVFRFGDWSIYDATGIVTGSSPNEQWSSFILHCRTWKEWEPVSRLPSSTWIKNGTVDNLSPDYKIEVTKLCNANMTAETHNRCPDCRAKIPDEVVALWKLQNFDKIQELNSV